ncbi:MAG: hypothetical protein KJZ64_05170 [Sphingomonadaceae bacterium]|nr:hypothetical protein [Sphingomonadaceae bacterium]
MTLEEILEDDERKRQFVLANVVIDRARAMRWYDANFLILFEAAKMLLGYTNPDRVAGFAAAFAPLRTNPGFRPGLIPGLLDAGQLKSLRDAIAGAGSDLLERHETAMFGRTVLHNLPAIDPLHHELAARVEELSGEPVTPAYSFVSLYGCQGSLPPHLDEPVSKWTIDICLDQNVEWPIHFSKVIDWPTAPEMQASGPPEPGAPDLGFRSVTLLPGDAVLFSGSAQWHYRDPMPNRRTGFCNLLFLHYYPQGTEALVYPERWAGHFGLPELAVLVTAYRMARKAASSVSAN